MYVQFYGLVEKPFALVPDPRYLFLASPHREALAHLLYGIEEGEGFIEVVGQVGTGKTTLCRTLVERVGPEVDLAFVFNPALSEVELLAAINREFGIATAGRSRAHLVDDLNQYLLERKRQGRRALLVIDEAQNLDPEVLEQIRLISNLETEREKLIQIVLIGQPELDDLLSRPDLRQLRQRVTVHWRLQPFTSHETAAYLEHRLRVAGSRAATLFEPRAVRFIHRASGGIPRLINALADRALLVGYGAGRRRIDVAAVRQAARELPATRLRSWWLELGTARAAAVVAAGFGLGLCASALPPFADWEEEPPPLQTARPPEIVPVAQPSPPPLPPPPTGLEGLRTRSAEASAAGAVDALLGAWGYEPLRARELDPNRIASAVRTVSPLRVLPTRSTREQLLSLDLPVLLEVELSPGERRYVALLGVASGEAELAVADQRYRVSIESLDRIATGRAFFLWANFESLPAMEPGMNGSAVRWLQARLTDLGYLRRGEASGLFDASTARAIRSFQAEHALESTGEVGPETLIALYQALEYDAPKLLMPREDEIS